ncbi:MAG: methionyl-tRNA formyltransferase [Lachnospiraceae bacterium]|nr:methionyl-tRNA formyltransferase [Lachnospiraceae bacterium]
MKIVFMGTPDYAAGALEALIEEGYEITAVVTQPDKPKGRSKELQFSPVKECALRHGIPVMQPRRIKTPEAIAELRQYEADVFVVAAFGQILSQEILDMPRLGSLNIHASLLPRYRGCSPIQHVIIDGEAQTGITIMQMDAGIDTGDMLYKKTIDIAEDETFETLHDKLMVLGGEAITEALPLVAAGQLPAEKQVDADSCYAPMIEKSMGQIDFSKEAIVIDRLIRGMNPWPSAYTSYKGKQLKIWKAVPVMAKKPGEDVASANEKVQPGEVIAVAKDYIEVATGSGSLRIYELQLEGKKRMSTHDFLLGVKMQPGEVLGC